MRRKLVAGLIAFGAVASVLATSATDVSARPSNQLAGVGSITWGPCDNPLLVRFGAECGMLSVPLDWSRPNGEKIQLAVSRVKHTLPDDQYQGVMLVNPGGPGGSGLIYSIFGALLPEQAVGGYDWIGFDPRGVGSSVPALSCDPNYFNGPRPRYEPTTVQIEASWLTRSITYAVKCRVNGGRLLDHVKTTDSVEDMNAIRQALGASQINYYGFSYGTYLGQVFATVHPDLVRRMVLDANVDPRRIWYPANIDQDYAFEITIKAFFDWVARHDDAYGLGTTEADVEAKYYATLESLAANPNGQLGAAEWADAVLEAGYYQVTWPDVGAAFAALVNDGDPGPATDLYIGQDSPGDDNGFAMYLGTECSDTSWPRSWSFWHRDNTRVYADAPFLTWGNAWFNAPCAFWLTRPGRPVEVNGSAVPPILLLDETLDAATPYPGSLEVRRRFPQSSLIATVGGTTHAGSLQGNACVDDRIFDYLATGALPARQPGSGADLECQPLPEPEPTSAAVTAQARAAAPTLAELLRQLHTAAVH